MLEVDIVADMGVGTLVAGLGADRGVTAIVGPSGAGKTTLLRAIAGLLNPNSGTIKFNGKTWLDRETGLLVPTHRRGIGMVFQEPRLLPHLSVRANIALGGRRFGRGGGGKNGSVGLAELADDLSIGHLLKRRPAKLSGGEKQRVMLARALIGGAGLILCDEPAVGLDTDQRGKLIEAMVHHFAQLDAVVLYVTHAPEEAAKLATSMVRMEDGILGEMGPVNQVLLAGGSETIIDAGTSTTLQGRVLEIDEAYALAVIGIDEQRIELAAGALKPGQETGVRLWARDLIIALEPRPGLSARNQLAGTIVSISGGDGASVEVQVAVNGVPVLARITKKSLDELGLGEGREVVLIFKSASVE
ncbi:MAG: ATP-binding cassette domain-containing protein [Alphaproteobacteria bacterium]|nr:ATP-binding cassette domain-containing protein [Alphaproteobacteria bacterium]